MDTLTDTEMLQSVSGFAFSGKPVDQLDASEYTIACILGDSSGSIHGFQNDLEKAIGTAVEACRKSPRAENMLIRVAAFNTSLWELHGFIGLNDVDVANYKNALNPSGGTALHDASLEAVETVRAYAEKLAANNYSVNGIAFVITDGDENSSRTGSPAKIKAALEQIRKDEKLQSFRIVLIGIGTGVDVTLQQLATQCGFDQYVGIGDATPQKLARLAAFVSKSISSSSQALATNGASQNITF